MSMLLNTDQRVRLDTSEGDCVVERLLGAGAQGEVYRVRMPDGTRRALKWYFPSSATREQEAALYDLVARGAPDARFLWPLEMATIPGRPGFGYLMALRPPNDSSIVDLMRRRVEPSFRALATAGFQLADSFLRLHAMGLCYRDISFGNVFFDAESGDITICDNDNVGVDDPALGSSVGGTIGFMAPEVVRGEAAPSRSTDLFSLAVLLFYMLMIHHPLEGRQELRIRAFDAAAKKRLYGTRPVFIWDPDDHSNEPDPEIHANAVIFWGLYPRFLRELFTRSFTAGIRDPAHGRVQESEWRAAMIRLRDSILYCGCGEENFLDLEGSAVCWSCGKRYALPRRLLIGRDTIVLNHDTKLYPHHLRHNEYVFDPPLADVSRHPTDAKRWGLRNRTEHKWVAELASGDMRDVMPGRSVALEAGTKIQFGNVKGEIVA
jgi:DNA-binding helix-hairpin-helix protein with protein kinase domain